MLLVVAALLVGVVHTGAPLLAPGTTAPLTRFTAGQFINLALGARELPWPTHTDLLGYPTGAGFAPLLWPALPVARALGATAALTLVFTLLPLANALCGWVAARWLGATPWGAFAAGGLCALNAWSHNTLGNGQLEQVPLGAAALTWAGLVAAFQRRTPVWVPGALVVATGLAAPHVGLASLVGVALLALAFPLAPDLFPAPRARERLPLPRRVAAVLPALVFVGIGAALVHLYHSPQFGDGTYVFAPKGAVTTAQAGPELPGVFEVATPRRLFLPPDAPAPQAQGVAHSAYLGWVPLLAALLASRAARPWRLVAVVLAVAALGEHVDVFGLRVPLPAAWYGELSTALSRSANPYRLVLGAVAALSLASAWSVRRAGPALLLVALAWGEVGLTRTRAIPLPSQPWAPNAATVALRGGVGPVLDLPLASPACPDVGWGYATQAMWHDRPVPVTLRFDWRAWGTLEGWAHRAARTLDSPDCDARLPALLDEAGFTAVVLHADARCPIPPRARACLDAAYGPGDSSPSDGAPTLTWWSVGGER